MCKTHELLEAAVNTDQKVGPCGSSKGRSATPAVYKPGETITVKWTETIDHQPSWYRISFNPNGDTFEDPTSYTDNTGKHPNTLADGIQDGAAAMQELRVTLPNITCEKCVLQLIQVMGDKGGNGFGGNDGAGGKEDNDDLYYACADIVLRGDATPSDAGPTVDAGATSTSDASASSDAAAIGSTDANVGSSEAGAAIPGTNRTDGGSGGTNSSGATTGGGSVATGVTPDASAMSSSPDAGIDPGAVPNGAPPAEGDDGCTVAPGRTSSLASAHGFAFAMLALLYSRRRRA